MHAVKGVAIDMTPLEAGGQNGGAGVVATSLVRHLSELAPHAQRYLEVFEAVLAEQR